MKPNNTIKFFTIICCCFCIVVFKQASAKILYDSNSSIISSYISGTIFLQKDSFKDKIFDSLEVNLFAKKEISNDFYVKYYTSAIYLSNRKQDDSYSILDEIYIGIDSNYGSVYVGNTPSVYYNGFPAGWLDYKLINSQHDAIDPNAYGSFFTTKAGSKSIFYSYKWSNFKMALQGSAKETKVINLDNQNRNLTREHSYGVGIGYAYGPIQLGGSYINSKFKDSKESNDNFIMNIASIGAKVDIFGLYSAIGVFYDNNRWQVGNEAYSFQYLIKYDKYRIFNKPIVPQIAYSYKYYTVVNKLDNSNVIANNDIYFSLSYFLSSTLEVFVAGKFDMRKSFQVAQLNNIIRSDKYLRYNMVGIGLKGVF